MTHIRMDLSKMFNVSFMGLCQFNDPWLHFSRCIDEFVFYFVKEGTLFIEEDERKFEIKEGEYIILEPNKLHRGYRQSAVTYYYMHISNATSTILNAITAGEIREEVIKGRLKSLSLDITTSDYKEDCFILIPKYYKMSHTFEIYKELDKACYELSQKNENFKLMSILLSTTILINMNRQYHSEVVGKTKQRTYLIVRDLVTYLESNLTLKLTIDDIEAYTQLNYNYLNRLFKSSTGLTIKTYLNLLRIQKAQELIRGTKLNFSEISEQIGIDDPFYFSKLFKQKTGLTPSQYKNEINIVKSKVN